MKEDYARSMKYLDRIIKPGTERNEKFCRNFREELKSKFIDHGSEKNHIEEREHIQDSDK